MTAASVSCKVCGPSRLEEQEVSAGGFAGAAPWLGGSIGKGGVVSSGSRTAPWLLLQGRAG
jgi:hypothetical protein